MNTNVVPLNTSTAVIAAPTDLGVEIRNTFDARERLQALQAALATRRADAAAAFLKSFVTDLAALKPEGDKAFVDTQFTRFTAWKAADDEFAKRQSALTEIALGLEARIVYFSATQRVLVVAMLRQQIDTLSHQLAATEADEAVIEQRIEALRADLRKLTGGAAKPKAKAKKKSKAKAKARSKPRAAAPAAAAP
jgi:chaperonin cofactor prefoldin